MGNLISRKKKKEKYAIKSPYDNEVKPDRRTTSHWGNVTEMRTEPNNSDIYPAVVVVATLYTGDEDYKPSPTPVDCGGDNGGCHGDSGGGDCGGGGGGDSGGGGGGGGDGGGGGCGSD